MPKYVTIPARASDNPHRWGRDAVNTWTRPDEALWNAATVHEADRGPIPTGVLDADGQMICRVPASVVFGFQVKSR